jgi:ribosomal protein L10
MSNAKFVVVAEYRGLTVKKTEELRRLLARSCEMIVAKNNIPAALLKPQDLMALTMTLWTNSVVLSMKDSIVATKVLFDFARKTQTLLLSWCRLMEITLTKIKLR